MDPDVVLQEIRERMVMHKERARRMEFRPLEPAEMAKARRDHGQNLVQIADLFETLDRWISTGGFLPKDWQPKPLPADPPGLWPMSSQWGPS